jgi:hypothetical protein
MNAEAPSGVAMERRAAEALADDALASHLRHIARAEHNLQIREVIQEAARRLDRSAQ